MHKTFNKSADAMQFRTNEKPQLSAIWIISEDDPQQHTTLEAYLEVLAALPCRSELSVVGNGVVHGFEDDVFKRLRQSSVPSRVLKLHRGCDVSTAIQVGFKASRGQYVALLPRYLQTDPMELSRMILRIEDGADYVASWRSPRVDSKWNALQSNIFNTLARCLTGVSIHDLNSELRVMKREVADSVPIYGDLDRFLPILAATHGYDVQEIKTRHLEERVRKGDYRLGVYVRRILDLITLFFLFRFTRKPLRFFGLLGSAAIGLGTITTAIVSIQRLLGTPLAGRPLLVFAVLLIVIGVQSFSLGLLGELIIFTHGRKLRHHYVEKVYENNPARPASSQNTAFVSS